MSGSVSFSPADIVDARRFGGYATPGNAPGLVDTMGIALAALSPPEITMMQTFLAQLRTLETAVPTAGGNLDTERAAVWFHNQSEIQDREGLYRNWRLKFCWAIGIGPGPFLDMLIPAAFVV